jgi:hypothetical protein
MKDKDTARCWIAGEEATAHQPCRVAFGKRMEGAAGSLLIGKSQYINQLTTGARDAMHL